VNPDDPFARRFLDTFRQLIYVGRHQWKDVLRDSSQGVSEVPGADFFGEVSGVDAAIDAILATGEGDYSGVAIAGSGILLGKLKVAGGAYQDYQEASHARPRWGNIGAHHRAT
jgi:hypothetical protein